MACYRLGTMLYIDTQNGEEATKTAKFQQYIGGNAVCTKIIMMSTKGCGQLTSNDNYFSDSWFSGVKTAEEAMAKGVDYFGPVNTIHKGFCLSTLEKLAKEWPGGLYLVIKSAPIVTGDRPLTNIG